MVFIKALLIYNFKIKQLFKAYYVKQQFPTFLIPVSNFQENYFQFFYLNPLVFIYTSKYMPVLLFLNFSDVSHQLTSFC